MINPIKERLVNIFNESVFPRRAMFIPLMCVMAFGLVGYVAVDKEAPTISSDDIEVLYGSSLDKSMFDIRDNRDDLEALDVQIDAQSYDAYQLGTYDVEVSATDMFANTTTKTVRVHVVDKSAPEFTYVNEGSGYVVLVEVGGSEDISSYVKATDNVDGDVTAFIETSKELDSSKKGSQILTLSVSDNAGNTTSKDVEFYVSDTSAPSISFTEGASITIDYGEEFNYKDYISVSDNYDASDEIDVEVKGEVNTSKEDTYSLEIIATDSEGNESVETLKVKVDDISAPELSISKSSLRLKLGSGFDASDYLESAIDNKDGNLTSKVSISSNVDSDEVGDYRVTYRVSDSSGNEATKTLSVEVYDPSARDGVANSAVSRVGYSYVSGGSGPTAFDCSGLTSWAYRQNGIYIPRTAAAQYSYSTRISKSELQPGDLVFFSGTTGASGITHVGIYIGSGRFVHAGTPSTGVITSSLYSSYYVSHYAGAGRV